MNRLLNLLWIKQGKYTVMVKDTVKDMPAAKMCSKAKRSYKYLLDADKNWLRSYLRKSFIPTTNDNENSL